MMITYIYTELCVVSILYFASILKILFCISNTHKKVFGILVFEILKLHYFVFQILNEYFAHLWL